MDLLEACDKPDLNKVKELIKAGADVNIEDIDGYTPLYFAIINDDSKMVEELVLAGADIDHKVDDDPLAMYLFNLDTLKILIDNGVDLDATNNNGKTILMAAIEENRLEIVQELIPHANIDQQTKHGVTALFTAVNYDNVDCVKMLLEAGADVNIKTEWGETSLERIMIKLNGVRHPAVTEDDVKDRIRVLELLKQYGAEE